MRLPPHITAALNTGPRCVCGKVCLPSMKLARQIVRQYAAIGHTRYVYRCSEQGEIHLTRRPQWDTRRQHNPQDWL